MSHKWLALATAGVIATSVAACGSASKSTSNPAGGGTSSSSAPVTLTGSGSTFAAPIYGELGTKVKGDGVTINYQATGSGQGISDLTAGSVDFAGSDPPMENTEVTAAEKKGVPVHI